MRLRRIERDKHWELSLERLPKHHGDSKVINLKYCCPFKIIKSMDTWRPTPRVCGHDDSRVMLPRRYRWVIGAGTSDYITVAVNLDDSEGFYVLTENYGLGYVGLEYCHPHNAPNPYNGNLIDPDSVFFNDVDAEIPKPKPWSEYEWHTQIRRLAEYLPT